ncbi:LPS export ABC transporter permease LptG [Aliidongia dinghuensis]|uniref:LPS export ABC transporter permease LptG n=1 Tax=Aliidongia dinghuensis TaxID=1867774 RepID=A0A8J2YWC2_9PROT|nr:LPS export ABC transporter permease LptG [Aliidongia dinghuensis]GGF25257.1 LPS export ABC transporter permease LptG [Aliidongia dinghuensis]
MNFPTTLFGYIARQFLVWFTGTFIMILLLIFIGNLIELLRRAAAHPEISIGLLVKMAALQLPYTAQQVTPFAVLFGSIFALARMTRSQELIVARAAGVSVWQFLTPSITIAFLIGVIGVTVFNPLASSMQATFKQLEARFLKGQADDSLLLSSSGLWLRQSDTTGTQAVIHAQRLTPSDMTADGVTLYFFRDGDRMLRRIDAKTAVLHDGRWLVKDAWEWRPERKPESQHLDQVTVETNLTPRKIEDSFATPDTMSFWALPGFIDLLEKSGFSAQRHKLYFQSLLARPVLLCAMVLIAAIFSLRMQRRGGATTLVVGGVAAGFLLYFLTDVVFALGLSSTIPVALAAWTPAGISTLLGATLLLHLEDG